MQTVKISFVVSGYVYQQVQITDENISPEKLQKMLNSGEAVTTIQDNGSVEIVAKGTKIGEVKKGMTSKSDLEYSNFKVE